MKAKTMKKRKIYITNRTDGRVGFGTKDEPWDGSTPERFEAAMKSTPPDTHIFLGRGTFPTHGRAFIPQDGWHVTGHGDNTILKLTGEGGGFKVAVRSSVDYPQPGAFCNDNLWENFTINCNTNAYPNPVVTGGIHLHGSRNTIRGVRVINAGSLIPNTESFGIGNGGQGRQALIEGCTVEQPCTGALGGLTAILVGNVTGYKDGTIRGCHVNLKDYIKNNGGARIYSHAYSAVGQGMLVEGNKCESCGEGFYEDTWSTSDLIVRGNRLILVQYGIHYNCYTSNGGLLGGEFYDNEIWFDPERSRDSDVYYGFRFLGNPAREDWTLRGISIHHNMVWAQQPIPQQTLLAHMLRVGNGSIKNNTYSGISGEVILTHCGTIDIANNFEV